MKPNTGIQFKIYLMAESRPGLEEGWIRIWSQRGKRITGVKNASFDSLDEVADKIRVELAAHGIKWPPLAEVARNR